MAVRCYGVGMAKTLKPALQASSDRRFNRSLAIAVREAIAPEVLVAFGLEIMKGNDPLLVEDKRVPTGWRIETRDVRQGGTPSTLQQKMQVMEFIRNTGWGLPVQSVALEADLSIKAMSAGSGVDSALLAGLSYQDRKEIQDKLQAAIARVAGRTDTSDAVDAEFALPEGSAEPVE